MHTADHTSLRTLARLASPRSMHLIVLPTEQCNFRCTYCYEDFAIGRMGEATIVGLEKLIAARVVDDLDDLEIDWFGGEPLAATDIVLRVNRGALAACRPRKVVFRSGITTNGWFLTVERVRALGDAGVGDYQISLDGPPDVHDRTRRRANRGGSFEGIWTNLLAMRATDLPFRVLLRIHLTRENLPALGDLLDLLERDLLQDSRFKVFFKAVERLGGPNDAVLDLLEGDEKDDAVGRLEHLLKKRFGDQVVLENDPSGHICYAARANSLIVRADGSLAKCTVALRDPRNRIGQLTQDGRVQIDRQRMMPWLRGIDTLDPAVLACPLQTLPPLAPRSS